MNHMPRVNRLFLLSSLLVCAPLVCHAQRPELVVQTGHSGPVNSVAFSPDGKLLATGSGDNTISLWDVGSGAQLRSLVGHRDAVTSVAFSPDGRTLASVSPEIKLWDVTTGAMLRTLGVAVTSIAFSPDGRTLASINSEEQAIRLWDAATGAPLRILGGHGHTVNSIAFSPDGKTLASSSWDKTIRLWDAVTGAPVRTLTGDRELFSAVFSPDGKMLAGVSGDKTIRLWDVASGAALRSFDGKDAVGVVFSPDGKTLAGSSWDDTIKLWDVASGAPVRTLAGHSDLVLSLAFSPDGKTLAVSGYDLSINAADGGTRLVVSGVDRKVKLWDMTTGTPLRTLDSEGVAVRLVFSPDGKTLAAGNDGQNVQLWDVATGALLRTLGYYGNGKPSLAFSPDGKTLAIGATLWDVASDAPPRYLDNFSRGVVSAAYSPDGRTLACGNEQDKTLKLLDAATGAVRRSIDANGETPRLLGFSPDGRLLVGADWRTIKLWDAATGARLRTFSAHGGAVNAVAFSPDGRTLVSGEGHTLSLWDVASGARLYSLTGHSDDISEVAFSTDGRIVASAGEDAKTKLWDAASGRELASMISLDATDWAVMTPDGLFDGSPSAWGKMVWRAQRDTLDFVPVEAYFNDFYYPGLLADIFTGKNPQAPAKIEDKDRRQPLVKIVSAKPVARTEGAGWEEEKPARPYLRVKVEVTEAPATKERKGGSGARDVRLFRGGTLVKIWRGDVLNGKSIAVLETDVPVLPSENLFTAYAFNADNVKSRDATLTAKGGGEDKPLTRTAYVLAVGVNKYANSGYDLKYAVADAVDFGAEWKKQQERLKQYERIEVVSLLDAEATKANILLAIERLVDLKPEPLPAGAPRQLERLKYAEPQDAVVVFFAGHGTAAGKRFYLIPHDLGYKGERDKVDAGGLRLMLEHSVSDEDLERAFEGLQGGELVFVIDACNSGQALEAEEKRRGPMNSKGLAQLAYEKGMYILTASQSLQFANEEPVLGHGYLTYVLVSEGLRSLAADKEPADGSVLIREWFDYAEERVPRLHEERMRGKTPEQRAAMQARKTRELGLIGVEDVQRPRVFYRREPAPQALVVAKPDARPPANKP